MSRASIWYSAALRTRSRAKASASVNSSLPLSDRLGSASRSPASTKPVPQPISSKLAAAGKCRRRAHTITRLRDRNQKLLCSISASSAKASNSKPPSRAGSGENLVIEPTTAGVAPQVAQVQLSPRKRASHAKQRRTTSERRPGRRLAEHRRVHVAVPPNASKAAHAAAWPSAGPRRRARVTVRPTAHRGRAWPAPGAAGARPAWHESSR